MVTGALVTGACRVKKGVLGGGLHTATADSALGGCFSHWSAAHLVNC